MSAHTPHELHEEFPRDEETLRQLKMRNRHFANLAERYHAVNRAVHRIEAEVEPASDPYLQTLKKQRLSLLDEIVALIEQAEANLAAA